MCEKCNKEEELYQLVAALIVKQVLKEAGEHQSEIDAKLDELTKPTKKGKSKFGGKRPEK